MVLVCPRCEGVVRFDFNVRIKGGGYYISSENKDVEAFCTCDHCGNELSLEIKMDSEYKPKGRRYMRVSFDGEIYKRRTDSFLNLNLLKNLMYIHCDDGEVCLEVKTKLCDESEYLEIENSKGRGEGLHEAVMDRISKGVFGKGGVKSYKIYKTSFDYHNWDERVLSDCIITSDGCVELKCAIVLSDCIYLKFDEF